MREATRREAIILCEPTECLIKQYLHLLTQFVQFQHPEFLRVTPDLREMQQIVAICVHQEASGGLIKLIILMFPVSQEQIKCGFQRAVFDLQHSMDAIS